MGMHQDSGIGFYATGHLQETENFTVPFPKQWRTQRNTMRGFNKVPQSTGVVVVYMIHEKTTKQPRLDQNAGVMCAMIIAQTTIC